MNTETKPDKKSVLLIICCMMIAFLTLMFFLEHKDLKSYQAKADKLELENQRLCSDTTRLVERNKFLENLNNDITRILKPSRSIWNDHSNGLRIRREGKDQVLFYGDDHPRLLRTLGWASPEMLENTPISPNTSGR